MKKLLISTALVAATGMPVFTQTPENVFRQEADPKELHASEFIGMRVYRTDALEADSYEGVQEGWDDIGEINDVVFSREGSIEAVLVDIGGFLGLGENQVAVDMDSIQFVADSATPDQEVDFFLILNTPREMLEEAPTYGMMGSGAEGADEAGGAVDGSGASGEDTSENENGAERGEIADMATDDEPETDDQTRSSGTGLAREGYVPATESDLVADELTGAVAYDTNAERIGEISELLLAEDGKIESAVVDVGGFLGIGEKPVQLEMSQLDIMRAEDGRDVRVYISMSEEELESLPEFEK